MKRLRVILTALLALAATAAAAQTAPADTLARQPRGVPRADRWIPAAIGAGMFVEGAIGAAVHPDAPDAYSPSVGGKHSSVVADVAQYVPLAFPWAMKAFGAPTRSSWARTAVSQAFGTALMAGGVYLTKGMVNLTRPDGTDSRSFPSGHAAWAFMGATMTAIELGDLSPWYTVGAYTFATGVAMQRAIANRHFPTDVVAGAGIGVFAAELGYYIGDVIFGDRGLANPDLRFAPEKSNPSFLSLSTNLLWPMGRIDIAGSRMVRLPSVSAGVRGGVAIGDHWGLTLSALLLSTPLQLDTPQRDTYLGSQSSVGLFLAPYYVYALSRRIYFTAEIGAGYYKHLRLKSVDNAIYTGWGTPAGVADVGAVFNLTDLISCRASVGYSVYHYHYTLHPSAVYSVDAPATASGTTGGLTVGLSTRINFR